MSGRTYHVETSVWGMIPKGQPGGMREASLRFLRRRGRLLISAVVTDEILLAPEPIQQQIYRVLESIECEVVSVTAACRALALRYHDAGIIPARKVEDALHVAVATVYNADVLVSWNHKHIANIRKTELYRGVNLMAGYPHTPQILTPVEVLHG
ncbi:MAG: PIN domain-containing protein [Planctomycetaceae bacterium]